MKSRSTLIKSIYNKVTYAKYFTVKNKYVDMSNTKNQFYSPSDEMNYNVYDTTVNEVFTPSFNLPAIPKDGLVIFKYTEPQPDSDGFIKLPQVPYEIKEHAMKGFLYTFFLTAFGRMLSAFTPLYSYVVYPFIPAGIFAYQYTKALWLMYNSVYEIKLHEDGRTIELGFKFRSPMKIDISQIIKKKEETFLNECYTEPMLYPIQINRVGEFGKFSLRSHLTVYLYSESHSSIKQGEILKAIINNQPINIQH